MVLCGTTSGVASAVAMWCLCGLVQWQPLATGTLLPETFAHCWLPQGRIYELFQGQYAMPSSGEQHTAWWTLYVFHLRLPQVFFRVPLLFVIRRKMRDWLPVENASRTPRSRNCTSNQQTYAIVDVCIDLRCKSCTAVSQDVCAVGRRKL